MSNLVLWGHHLDEYQEMFDISTNELKGRFLEYASGPSAFNLEITPYARQCISADPLFCLDEPTLKSKVKLIFANMVEQVTEAQDQFNFTQSQGLQGLIKKRQQGMDEFFNDYHLGKEENRYFPLQQVELPFKDFHFDLAISSHYFFGQIDNLDLDLHIQVIKELARVAKEVRIFPLIDKNGNPSSLLGPFLLAMQQEKYGAEVRSVPYSLEPQGNAMLRIWSQACPL